MDVRDKLAVCHRQLTGPTGHYHRAAVLRAMDRLLDEMADSEARRLIRDWLGDDPDESHGRSIPQRG